VALPAAAGRDTGPAGSADDVPAGRDKGPEFCGSAADEPWRPLGESRASGDLSRSGTTRPPGESGRSGTDGRRCEPVRPEREVSGLAGESGVVARGRGDSSGGTFRSSAARSGVGRRVREARAPIVSDDDDNGDGSGSAGGICHADAESSFDRRGEEPGGGESSGLESGGGGAGGGRPLICFVASSSSGARRSGTSMAWSGRACAPVSCR
jgi:hypothetical protein